MTREFQCGNCGKTHSNEPTWWFTVDGIDRPLGPCCVDKMVDLAHKKS